MKKWDTDFLVGKEKRDQFDQVLNEYFIKKASTLQVRPAHIKQKIMKVSDKRKNNTASCIILTVPYKKAMGLHRLVIDKQSGKVLPLIYMNVNTGFYLKLPKDYIDRPKQYIELLAELNFHALPFDSETNEVGNLISFHTINKYWRWSIATSKGNKNRLTFHISISKIHMFPLERKGLFPEYLEDKISAVMTKQQIEKENV